MTIPPPAPYQEETLQILSRADALTRNTHVVYTSGKHGDTYVEKEAVYPYVVTMSRIGQIVAEAFIDLDVDVVLAPTTGGIILGYWAAFHLSMITRGGRRVVFIFARKDERLGFTLSRGYADLLAGKRVLVIDDVLTTGETMRRMVALAQAHDGIVVGVGALCNRGGVTPESLGIDARSFHGVFPPRFVALATIPFEAWDEKDCPLCAKDVPINVTLGHGAAYLAKRDMPWWRKRLLASAAWLLKRFRPDRD